MFVPSWIIVTSHIRPCKYELLNKVFLLSSAGTKRGHPQWRLSCPAPSWTFVQTTHCGLLPLTAGSECLCPRVKGPSLEDWRVRLHAAWEEHYRESFRQRMLAPKERLREVWRGRGYRKESESPYTSYPDLCETQTPEVSSAEILSPYGQPIPTMEDHERNFRDTRKWGACSAVSGGRKVSNVWPCEENISIWT